MSLSQSMFMTKGGDYGASHENDDGEQMHDATAGVNNEEVNDAEDEYNESNEEVNDDAENDYPGIALNNAPKLALDAEKTAGVVEGDTPI
jgi:uncharacterized cupredoxin-like copper-binding protein